MAKVVRSPAATRQRSYQRSVRSAASLRGLESRFAGQDMIERHGDVDAERALHLHRESPGCRSVRSHRCGSESGRRTRRPCQAREAEDLETAAIGEDGAGPIHEAVDAAHLLDEVVARAQVEVVGVHEQDFGAGAATSSGMSAFTVRECRRA